MEAVEVEAAGPAAADGDGIESLGDALEEVEERVVAGQIERNAGAIHVIRRQLLGRNRAWCPSPTKFQAVRALRSPRLSWKTAAVGT